MLYEILVVLLKSYRIHSRFNVHQQMFASDFQIFLVAIHSRHHQVIQKTFILGFHLLNCILSSCTSVSMHNSSWLDLALFLNWKCCCIRQIVCVHLCIWYGVCGGGSDGNEREKTTCIILYGTVFPQCQRNTFGFCFRME